MHARGREQGPDTRRPDAPVRAAAVASAAADAARLADSGSLTPQAATALQRAAGNAALAAAVQRDAHAHGPGCGHGPAVQRSAVHDVLRAPGRPLEDSVRDDMESRLGADFSDVRVHTDAAAKASAAEVGARAYTSGSHVVIGEGGTDRHTLAHELTHVIQQRQGPVAGTDNGSGLSVSDPSDRFEREAEANAHRALSAQPAPIAGDAVQRVASGSAVAVQRMGKHLDNLRDQMLANYRQRQAEFPGNERVPVEARVNAEHLVDMLLGHADSRGELSRTVKELLTRLAEKSWCITAGVHAGGLGGGGGADPNRHITLNVNGAGVHVQLMANDKLQNITGI